LLLNLALSYGGRDEIAMAVRKIAESYANKELESENITEEMIEQHLYTAGLPDPDLFIRTGGEARLSNFLLWQASYAELYFTDTMWPDFRRNEFTRAIADYQGRERRYGKTSAQLSAEK